MSKVKFQGLDAARGLLSLIVCLAHGFTILVRPTRAAKDSLDYFWVLSSRFAVLGFFVLSGFVIAYSIEHNIRRHGRFEWREFAASRFVRIAPPLIFCMALTALLAAMLGAVGMQKLPAGVLSERDAFRVDYAGQLMSLLTFGLKGHLSGGLNGPLWSLTYEMQLYVLAALAAACLFGEWRRWAALSLAVSIVVLAIRGNLLQLVCAGAFLCGSAACLLRQRAAKLPKGLIPCWLVCLLLASVAAMLAGDINNLDSTRNALLSQLLFGAAFALLLLVVAGNGSLAALSWTGALSYTLYIIHYPLLLFVYFLVQPYDSPWLVFAIAVPTVVCVAALLAPWLEDVRLWRGQLRLQGVVIPTKSLPRT